MNMEMAADYLRRSLSLLSEARAALERGDAPICVRRSQEAIEMAAKALLRAISIEYPRRHDVSDALLAHSDRMPEPIRGEIGEIASLVSELAAVRGPAMYGMEAEGIPASRLFSPGYASEVLERVDRAVRLVEGVLRPRLEELGLWGGG